MGTKTGLTKTDTPALRAKLDSASYFIQAVGLPIAWYISAKFRVDAHKEGRDAFRSSKIWNKLHVVPIRYSSDPDLQSF